ncbi:MAG: CPBP family intramembrane metalloprotease [Ruminococcaceae bacterium]|nr:CPBP family intramembrane metalloprotease [Oscillospiraceae bacterium]
MQNYYPPYQNMNPQQPQANPWEQYFQLKRKTEIKELIVTGLVIGATLIASLLIQTVAVVVLMLSKKYDVYLESSLFQNTFNIIAVHILSMMVPFYLMSLILKKRFVSELIPRKEIGAPNCFAWVCFGMGCCIAANFVTAGVIELFRLMGYKLTQTEYNDPSSIIECIALVFSTAIAPAVCEEFAMRCCTMGALRRYGKGFAVVAVSIVFGLIHGNVIQFVFAFLLGLVFGYITIVTDSVIPAMFIHGLNNGISVASDIVKYAWGSSKSEYVGVICYLIWGALSVYGLIYLIIKKQIRINRQKKLKEPYSLSFGGKLLCLMPGFIIPIGILIFITIQTIVPIT